MLEPTVSLDTRPSFVRGMILIRRRGDGGVMGSGFKVEGARL
jgi:hypothetical protein